MTDAVVIGAGPNGLVAANMLADAGWDVLVLEAQPEPGGAVRSAELTLPGFCHDRFSSFYPLAGVSPALRDLDLSSLGLEWCRAEAALAHVFGNGRAAVLWADVSRTAESVEGFANGDGRAWRELLSEWEELSGPLVAALLGPYPPVGAALRLGARLRRPHHLAEFVRSSVLPIRRFVAEHLSGEGAAMLLAGNTLHTDLSPDSALGGFYGWLLAMLGQTVGFPVPKGGSGALTKALVDRLSSRGGVLRCSAQVTSIVVRSGRAVGVRLADGEEVMVHRGVAADVIAPKLYGCLLDPGELPSRFRRDLALFELDHGTVKVDWALSEPIPWIDPGARRAGTVHLGEGMDHLTRFSADLAAGRIPEQPFVLLGQMGRADPSRSPVGTETGWAYTHVPNTYRPGAPSLDTATTEAVVSRVESTVEQRAPGFRDTILARHVYTPTKLEAADANLMGGAINGGTSQLHQQLVFRPTVGRGGPGTPVEGLFLASSSAHPGGGVHGACGANAARAMLRGQSPLVRRRDRNRLRDLRPGVRVRAG